jgi:CxxC motif-containing protein
MIKKLTCIECPQGCQLEVGIENSSVVSVTGQKCKKGDVYAKQEIENPMRTLASTVLTKGLNLKMVPVKTNRPIPKARQMEAMEAVKKIRLSRRVKVGDVIIDNLLGLGVDLISTRDAT